MIGRVAVAALLMATHLPAISQVPPPPSLPGQSDLAKKIVLAIENKDLESYSQLLSNDVQVYQDNKIVANNKIEWLNLFGQKLSANGVHFKIAPGYMSTGRILFIEYFNSAGSWNGNAPSHCCWSHDAVAYDVNASGEITQIYRLRGGDKEVKL